HHVLSVVVSADAAKGDEARARGLRERAVAAAEHVLSTRAPDAIISARDDEVVIVLPETAEGGTPSRAARLGGLGADRLGALLREVGWRSGSGAPCREPAGIARSYAQARRTVETLLRMDRADRAARVVAFEDLGIHRLLLQVPNLAELRGFAQEVLGRLTE